MHELCQTGFTDHRGFIWKCWTRPLPPHDGGEQIVCKLDHAITEGNRNKAGYTATLVACGWAGAVFELLKHLARSSEAKDRKNIKKVKWGPTNRPTDQPTDRRTDKAGYRVA